MLVPAVVLGAVLTVSLPVQARTEGAVAQPITGSSTPIAIPEGITLPKMPGTLASPAPLTVGVNPLGSSTLALSFALPGPLGNALRWQPGTERCVTALARGGDGAVWVATEDAGVWRCDPQAPLSARWKQFMAKDGLGDDSAYALAIDKQGRVWAGTLNHGVSVWNGQTWKNYGVLDGPLGERVFSIKVCPSDGDVWIATNAGLTRYSAKNDSWNYITQADGLPSDQIQAIAFDKSGNIVVGTQCDGVALAQMADGYKAWRVEKGPEQLPTTPTGQGLPSSLINDALVARNGTIYLATTAGLSWSSDRGAHWAYVRGQDYAAKVKERYNGPPTGWAEAPGALLAEDYVSCLAEDKGGHLWLGHWRKGDEALEMQGSPSTGVKKVVAHEESGFVKAILPVSDDSIAANSSPLIARYNEGIAQSLIETTKSSTASVMTAVPNKTLEKNATAVVHPVPVEAQSPPPSFPHVAAAPTIDEIRNLSERVGASTSVFQHGKAAFLGEDWRTKGDWVGRYGRYYATLCSVQAPFDDTYASLMPFPNVVPQLGPHIQSDDSLRYWLHWVKTDNPNTLYNPLLGYRRQAEWDDHGETYPLEFEGPDLWSSLEVPPGTWRVSTYFFNKDGHSGYNCTRDYLLELRNENTPLPPYPAPKDGEQVTGEWLATHFGAYYAARTKIIEAAQKTPPIASARVRDFWGGVHKSFVLQGPATYWLRVARGGSFNTILSSIEWDEITPGKRWEDAPGLSWTGGKFNPPDPDVPAPPDPFLLDKILNGDYRKPSAPTEADTKRAEVVEAARALWAASDAAMDKQGGAKWQWMARLSAYRAAQANGASDTLLTNWRWKMSLWSDSDRAQWNDAMKRVASTHTIKNSETRSSQ